MEGDRTILRVIQDLKKVTSAILWGYGEQEHPVTDASAELHGLCGYLELLLQFDQKDRRRFLGPRKDYWDFLSVALQRNGGDTEVVRFVYTLDKLKTTVGRGRAFIRFCLAHRQLADTLQLCLLDPELTREWYGNQSPFLCPELSTDILETLYVLNGVAFDLELHRCDLDGGWPMFSESRCQDFSITQEKLRTNQPQEQEIKVTHLTIKGVQSKKTPTLFAGCDLQPQGDDPKGVCLVRPNGVGIQESLTEKKIEDPKSSISQGTLEGSRGLEVFPHLSSLLGETRMMPQGQNPRLHKKQHESLPGTRIPGFPQVSQEPDQEKMHQRKEEKEWFLRGGLTEPMCTSPKNQTQVDLSLVKKKEGEKVSPKTVRIKKEPSVRTEDRGEQMALERQKMPTDPGRGRRDQKSAPKYQPNTLGERLEEEESGPRREHEIHGVPRESKIFQGLETTGERHKDNEAQRQMPDEAEEQEKGHLRDTKDVIKNLKECLQKAEEQSQKKEKLLMTLEEKLRSLEEQLFRCQEQQAQLRTELEQRQQEAEKREDRYQQELKEQHELVRAMKRRMVELIQEKDSLWQKTEHLSSLSPGLCLVCSKVFGRLSRRYKCRGLWISTDSAEASSAMPALWITRRKNDAVYLATRREKPRSIKSRPLTLGLVSSLFYDRWIISPNPFLNDLHVPLLAKVIQKDKSLCPLGT
ncbi:RUN and FYVE domain-containing protein 4 [Phascolarctos cinereus]|uniref:RUN and FYVE domain-containing protein 4 n=1 Tax=Phascolarctos cinereus TaxID=38626 RepID=A0A6P5LLP3_PHACI|nr:RUN and FYVE domain-containing protein 4 [Phascolarctos cinereus]